MKKLALLGSMSLIWTFGCGGSLVGGECAEGYEPDGDLCVKSDAGSVGSTGAMMSNTGGGGSGGAGGSGGTGGTGAEVGGSSESGGAGGTGGAGGIGGAGGTGGAVSASSSVGGTGGAGGAGGASASSTAASTSASSGAGGAGGSSGTGSFKCFPPLAECQNVCVNLATDANNCGGCGVVCDAGASCSDGVCGAPTGPSQHGRAIVIGMNFAAAKLGDAQAVLLGNAIFSVAHEPVRAIDYSQFVSPGSPSFAAVTDLAIDEAVVRDRTIEAWTMPSPSSVALALGSHNFDLLVVRDQDAGTAADLAAAGSALAGPIAAFTAQGGVVVVLATKDGKGNMGTFLTSALGFAPTPLAPTLATLTNVAPADALGVGVLASFPASAAAAILPSALSSGNPLTTVIVDPAGLPLVLANP